MYIHVSSICGIIPLFFLIQILTKTRTNNSKALKSKTMYSKFAAPAMVPYGVYVLKFDQGEVFKLAQTYDHRNDILLLLDTVMEISLSAQVSFYHTLNGKDVYILHMDHIYEEVLKTVRSFGPLEVEIQKKNVYEFELRNAKVLRHMKTFHQSNIKNVKMRNRAKDELKKNANSKNPHVVTNNIFRQSFLSGNMNFVPKEWWNLKQFSESLEYICDVFLKEVKEKFLGKFMSFKIKLVTNMNLDTMFRDFGMIAHYANLGKPGLTHEQNGEIVNWKLFTIEKFLFPILGLVSSYGFMELVTEEDNSFFVSILSYYSEWFNITDQIPVLSKNICGWVIRQMNTLIKKGDCDSCSIILTNERTVKGEKYNDYGISLKNDYCKEIVEVNHEALNGFLKRICENYKTYLLDLRDNMTKYFSEPRKFELEYKVPFSVITDYLGKKKMNNLSLIRTIEVPKFVCDIKIQIKM